MKPELGTWYFIGFILLVLNACSFSDKKPANNVGSEPIENQKDSTNVEEISLEFEIRTYRNGNESEGWGYGIYRNGKLLIHQPHIPGINGIQGFQDAAEAEKMAAYVVYKLSNNIMPPSVTLSELDSLGIKYMN